MVPTRLPLINLGITSWRSKYARLEVTPSGDVDIGTGCSFVSMVELLSRAHESHVEDVPSQTLYPRERYISNLYRDVKDSAIHVIQEKSGSEGHSPMYRVSQPGYSSRFEKE